MDVDAFEARSRLMTFSILGQLFEHFSFFMLHLGPFYSGRIKFMAFLGYMCNQDECFKVEREEGVKVGKSEKLNLFLLLRRGVWEE